MRSVSYPRHALIQQSWLPTEKLHTKIGLLGHRYSSFQLCGYTGLLLGFVLSSVLLHRINRSQLVLTGITGVAILTFFSLVMATKILSGKELIIYYHHEIAVIATSALFLRLIHQPVLPYLDVTVLGVGLFLACGRIGCLMVGCCHGRPWHWGVAYGDQHVQADFPAYLAGVRLFPIQAVESVFALSVVGLGCVTVLRHAAPGTAFVLYVLLYAAGRFCFEFARGDAPRPYLWGFSEAQWTSLVIAFVELWGEHAGLVPHYRWHSIIPIALVSLAASVLLKRRYSRTRRFELLHPKHVREIAEWVTLTDSPLSEQATSAGFRFASASKVIHVAHTSAGLCVSGGKVTRHAVRLCHYALSSETGFLDIDCARRLASIIGQLRHQARPFELIEGNRGILHVIFQG